MTGNEYANLIAAYLVVNFQDRGIDVYREVNLGKTIIGKNRRVDIFALDTRSGVAFALECKYQDSAGTVDEKIPYALADLEALAMPAGLVYAGQGFSKGIQDMLSAAPKAAHCLPDSERWERTTRTRELDHMLAISFGWWDLVIGKKKPFPSPLPSPSPADIPKIPS